MASQKDLDKVYMDMANSMSTLSHGQRAKVGAVAVTANGVVITGVNGLPKALGNELEFKEFGIIPDTYTTKPTVIHAENAILVKCAREGVSMLGSTVYTSLSPCEHCASMLASAGVTRVVYRDKYRNIKGLSVLEQCGIIVEQMLDTI